MRRQKTPCHPLYLFAGSPECPDLRRVLAATEPGVLPDGRDVIFQFTKTAQRAVHIARLKGIAVILGFLPGHIDVLPRWVDGKIVNYEQGLVAGFAQIPTPPSRCHGLNSNFLFA